MSGGQGTMAYRPSAPARFYAERMRDWPRFNTKGTVRANATRWLPRDFEIFKRMSEDDRYVDAVRFAKQRYEEKVDALDPGDRTNSELEIIHRRIVPRYMEDKFLDKWRKLSASKASHTLTAHPGKDGCSHIHYDDLEARILTVRETARLQSFPAGFVFPCSMNQAFRQIGNAAAPLLAMAVAQEVHEALMAAARNLRSGGRRAGKAA